MTGSIVALVLFAVGSEAIPDAIEHSLPLDIDPCVGVDASALRNLVELELRDSRAGHVAVPVSVGVRCVDDAQEIRVEPWASRGDDGIRTIELPAAADADSAAQEARSRELALAIAELVRRLEITRPLAPAPPPSPPPGSPPVVIPVTPPPPEVTPGRPQLALLSSFDAFTGGQKLAGGDVCVAAPIGRWLVAEVRIGGRILTGATSPAGLTARAGTAAVAAGLNFSSRRPVGYVLMLRAQGYAIDYRLDPAADGGARTARLGAFVAVLESRLLLAVTYRLSVAAAVAAGLPIHGIVVRSQGAMTESLTGLALSAHLGAMVTF